MDESCACPGEQTAVLTVAYNGAPFCGFAKQPGQVTVQGNLEDALALVLRRNVETTCAGRTDSGVHALGQVVSFEVSEDEFADRNLHTFVRSLNALTDDALIVKDLSFKPAGFSARFDAIAREYHYHIVSGQTPPLFMKDFAWYVPGTLDVNAMRLAAKYLIGEHDFKSFCKAVSAIDKPTHRCVFDITIEPEAVLGEEVLTITVVGNAFLHSMVRTIVGTLISVGLGRRKPEWVGDVLAARDRNAAGETAPAHGLVFWQVCY